MKPEEVKRVAVIGAGVMGHSIAQVFAHAGVEVNLVDLGQAILDQAMQRVKGNLKTLVDAGRMDANETAAVMDRIHPNPEIRSAVRDADFALEAVVEVPDVKKEVFRQLEAFCPAGVVLASNTSSLDIFNIIEVKDPSRLVVAHWFAPPHVIPLVEIAPGPKTSPEVLAFTAALMKRIGKHPLVMRQFVQGHIVNRIQNVIASAVMEILINGWATPQEIDLAVKMSLGIRLPIVGVAQTLDFTGLKLLHDITSGLGMTIPLIDEKIKQGHLGVSTSKGIYDYGGRSEEEILRDRDSLFLKMLDHMEKIGAFKPV